MELSVSRESQQVPDDGAHIEVPGYTPIPGSYLQKRIHRRAGQSDSSQLRPILNSYRYRPLEAVSYVRLLFLYPGDGDEPLFCDIKHFDLNCYPPYEALSYVWANPDLCCRLHVAQHGYVKITASLNTALRDLRFANMNSGARILWADGVCINQRDLEEKEQQIRLMNKIYRQATLVLTYVGNATKESKMGLDLACILLRSASSQSHEVENPTLGANEAEWRQLGFPEHDHPSWHALGVLLQRPWSSRAWIALEFLSNKDDLMICGDILFPWTLLYGVVFHTLNGRLPTLAFDPSRPPDGPFDDRMYFAETLHLLGFMRMRAWFSNGGQLGWSLFKLLQRCHVLACSDPRDKIFAFLGIAEDREKFSIEVNYTKSVTEIFCSTAIALLQTSQSLELLSSIHANRGLDLPSWVPDWSTTPEFVNELLYDAPFYHAGGSTIPRIDIKTESKRLVLKALLIDQISSVSGLVRHTIENDGTSTCHIWLQEWLRQAMSHGTYPNGEAPINALWKTLIANSTHTGHEATENYVEQFEALRLRAATDYAVSKGYISAGFRDLDAIATDPLLPTDFVSRLESLDVVRQSKLWREFVRGITRAACARCLCITQNGYLGLVPPNSRSGDSVAVFLGGKVPFVLRAVDGKFELIGESYLHGIMKGEALEMKDVEIQETTLI